MGAHSVAFARGRVGQRRRSRGGRGDLEIEAGELVGLIGPNGAGKTTFIDAITGFVRVRGHGGTRRDDR